MATPQGIRHIEECLRGRSFIGPVIDLGCGDESQYYKHLFRGLEYITLDMAETNGVKPDITADIMNMPEIPSNQFGVALLLDVIEHLPDPFAAFREAARILQPRGILICTSVAAWPLHKHPFDYWRFMPDGLIYLCAQAQLTVYTGGMHQYAETKAQTVYVGAVKGI